MPQTPTQTIERLRALADPESYKQQLQEIRTQLIRRAEQLLIERDLNDSDPNISPVEKEAVLGQIDTALTSIDFRITEIDESLAAFQTGQQAGMNRKLRRKLLKDKNLAEAAGASSAIADKRGLVVVRPADEDASSNDDSAGGDDEEEGT